MLTIGISIWPKKHWWKQVPTKAVELKTGLQPLPSARVLTGWAVEKDAELDVVLEAPFFKYATGAQKSAPPADPFTEDAMARWQRTCVAASILEVAAVVLRSPASFTPSPQNGRRLVSFFKDAPRPCCPVVWRAAGLWTPDEQAAVCRQVDFQRVVDPLAEEVIDEPQDWMYGRVEGLGRENLSGAVLDGLADWCVAHEAGYCILDTPNAARDAKQLSALIDQIEMLEDRRVP